MGYALTHEIKLETEECCSCGTVFAMPSRLMSSARTNGDTFYCPLGHPQVYTKPEVAKLREALTAQTKAASDMAQRARQAEDREIAAKAELARHLKRTKAGVCPCCKRTFQQLARHMKTKHPEAAEPAP